MTSDRAALWTAATAVAGLFMHTVIHAQPAPAPPLTALRKDCSVSRDWLGRTVTIGRANALWLTCGNQRMVVVHPDNLIGLLDVKTADQALEVVRLFSSLDTYGLVRMEGCVEIVKDGNSDLFYSVASGVYDRYLRPSQVTAEGASSSLERSFVIERNIVCLDQRTYRVTEQLDSDGLYRQINKRAIGRAKTLGIVHWPAPH